VAALRLLLVSSLLPAIAALAGAMAGSIFGGGTSFVLASAAGTFGVLAMVPFAQRWRVLHSERGRGAAIGGLVGLALGISLAAIWPGQVAILAGASLLIGIGTLVGSGGGVPA